MNAAPANCSESHMGLRKHEKNNHSKKHMVDWLEEVAHLKPQRHLILFQNTYKRLEPFTVREVL